MDAIKGTCQLILFRKKFTARKWSGNLEIAAIDYAHLAHQTSEKERGEKMVHEAPPYSNKNYSTDDLRSRGLLLNLCRLESINIILHLCFGLFFKHCFSLKKGFWLSCTSLSVDFWVTYRLSFTLSLMFFFLFFRCVPEWLLFMLFFSFFVITASPFLATQSYFYCSLSLVLQFLFSRKWTGCTASGAFWVLFFLTFRVHISLFLFLLGFTSMPLFFPLDIPSNQKQQLRNLTPRYNPSPFIYSCSPVRQYI